MRLNRRVPNGTHGGVRGRGLFSPSYSIAKNSSISGLFHDLRPISDHPGTGLFCVYAVFSAFGFVRLFPAFVGFMGKFVGILGRFVGFMGKFVGILRGSLVFRANRWNIG